MKILISGHHIEITEGIKQSIENKFAKISKTQTSNLTTNFSENEFIDHSKDNLKSSNKLDKEIHEVFEEKQIFRIDHYLAKDVLQDVLSFRFSNSLFEPLWNKEYIEKIEVKFFETLGMEGRGAFYDGIGALRDVGQNHMLQMLASVTMENPHKLDADMIRKNRASLLESLTPLSTGTSSSALAYFK